MGKVIARKPGAHVAEGTTVSFSRDNETGLFVKIEQDTKTNILEYTTKKMGKPRISDPVYQLTKDEDWEYSFDITGPDGKPLTLFFKKVK
tara:strand:- start:2541 stop:2810 length:270 start_codon:yes stop_codon:yes gene_type:complete